MKKIIITSFVSVVLLLLLSCSSEEVAKDSPYGSYIYRSYNFLGDLVGEGTIYLNEADSNRITGNWNIREIRYCTNCGKQFGTGYLEGYRKGDSIFVNLNPTDVDIDTWLIGKFEDGKYEGKWKWTSIDNFGYEGDFRAERQ